MYKLFRALLTIIWILDVADLEVMAFLDTTVPINTGLWLLIWLAIPVSEEGNEKRTHDRP